MNPIDANILLVYTGGTIGMMQDRDTGLLRPFDFKELENFIPELARVQNKVRTVSLAEPLDSSNMEPKAWEELAGIIEDHYEDFDGFVILHGSDTLAYTASALSFMLENLAKPVILTGSQLPIGIPRSDARENLITTLELASAKKEDGSPMVPEVAVYFENDLYRGNRVYKHSAEDFEAFQSSNYPALAEVGVNIKFNRQAIRLPDNGELKVHRKMDDRIFLLPLFPGFRASTLWKIAESKDVKAIVLLTYGSGNAPNTPDFQKALTRALASGTYIINVSQCRGGGVKQGRYETSGHLLEAGVISAGDMTWEAAACKAMHLLAGEYNNDDFRRLYERNLRGEMSG